MSSISPALPPPDQTPAQTPPPQVGQLGIHQVQSPPSSGTSSVPSNIGPSQQQAGQVQQGPAQLQQGPSIETEAEPDEGRFKIKVINNVGTSSETTTTYTFDLYKLTIGVTEVDIMKMEPTKREELLEELAKAVKVGTSVHLLGQTEKIEFSLSHMKLSKMKIYGGGPDPIEEKDGSHKGFEDINIKLGPLLGEAAATLSVERQLLPISGCKMPQDPRGIVPAALHLLFDAYGEEIAKKSTTDSLSAKLELLRKKMMKESTESILNTELEDLFKQIAITNAAATLNSFSTPSALLDELIKQLQFQDHDVMNATDLSQPLSPASRTIIINPPQHPYVVPHQIKAGGHPYELVSATREDCGRVYSYTLVEGKWYQGNRDYISEIKESDMLETLKHQGTTLIYRQVEPTPATDQEAAKAREAAVNSLHSRSPIAANTRLHSVLVDHKLSKIVSDYNSGTTIKAKATSTFHNFTDNDIQTLVHEVTSDQAPTVVPIQDSQGHWSGLYINQTAHTIQYFDPSGNPPPEAILKLKEALRKQPAEKYNPIQTVIQPKGPLNWPGEGLDGDSLLRYFKKILDANGELNDLQPNQAHQNQTSLQFVQAQRYALRHEYSRYLANYGFN